MSFLLKNYDKLAAFVVFVGVALSAVFLATGFQTRTAENDAFTGNLARLAPAHPEAAPFDMAPYETAEKLRENPRRIVLPARNISGFFTTDLRVWCPYCKKPIPEKMEKCPACGAEIIPPKTPDDYLIYGPGIPITYGWVIKHNLNPSDASDADKDFDNDGFTNLEEFLAGTDPNNPASHPPYETKLVLADIESKPIGLRLTAASTLPSGMFRCSVVNATGRTFFVTPTTNDALRTSSGDKDLLELHGYKAVDFEKSSERRETNTGIRDVDTSILTLLRVKDGTTIQLHMNQPDAAEEVATLEFPLDNLDFTVIKGGAFTVRGTEFLVIEIDNRAQSVQIKNKATEKISTVKR